MRRKLLNLLFPIGAVAVLVAIWAIAAAAAGDRLILPSPAETAAEFFRMIGGKACGKFWAAFGMTFVRSLLAYVCAGAAAFVLAFLSRNGYVRRALYPIFSVLRAVPTMAVIFLFLIWVRTRWSPVWVAVTVLLPTMYAAFNQAFDAFDAGLEEMSRVYRVPLRVRLQKMYVPLLLPPLIDSLSFLSLSIKLVVAAEALAMTATSLGALLYNANITFETARLLAVSLAAVLAGFVIDGLTFTGKRLLPWI